MHYLLLSIALSVSVSVLLKLAPRWRLDVRQAIFVNYLVAAGLALALLQPDLSVWMHAGQRAWGLLVLLGLGLPAMFWVLALAVRHTGVVRTDAAMRLSLLLPLVAAFTLFGQALTIGKAVGVVLGLAAIALLIMRRNGAPSARGGMRGAGLLLLVFAGMGVIDILFKTMAGLGTASSATVLSSVFVLAAMASLLAVGWLYRRGRARWAWRHLLSGLLLGVLNFGNILFYIRAHQAMPADPALVFAAMNIGVIVLATLVGVMAFRERLNQANKAGLALAVVAVLVLAWV